jgi:predicted nucleic acid-binding protein
MKGVFADTYFYLALINAKDEGHSKAVAFAQSQHGGVITTAAVVTELADALCRIPQRPAFLNLLHSLRGDTSTVIVNVSQELFDKGLSLYESRPDKEWSLTDCVSFVVMNDQSLTDALTSDHHFEQAGFRALLKG